MRNILLGMAVLAALCGAARAGDAGRDPRPLTAAEVRIFYPLVCRNRARIGRRPICAGGVIGNPNGKGSVVFSLDAIGYGAFSHPGADEAYATYTADFESHAMNFGGGVLFAHANGQWRLVRWYPSGQHYPCVALPAAASDLQTHLCLTHYSGSGEADSAVWVEGLPQIDAKGDRTDSPSGVIGAHDFRWNGEFDQANYQCTLPRAPDEGILLAITDLTRAGAPGVLAQSHIIYAAPQDVAEACLHHRFARVRTKAGVARYTLHNGKVTATTPIKLATQD